MSVDEKALCRFCLAAVQGFRHAKAGIAGQWLPHQPGFTALRRSAEDCPLCLWFWKGAVGTIDRSTLEELEPDAYREICNANGSPRLVSSPDDVFQESDLVVTCTISARFGWYAGQKTPSKVDLDTPNFMSANFGIRRAADHQGRIASVDVRFEQFLEDAGGKVTSLHHVQLLKHWLDTCLTAHKACSAITSTTSNPWRPTRLLELTHLASSGLRLRESSQDEYEYGVRYIALSHRWASGKQLLLLDSNLEELRKEIPVNDLKASIRDALRVATRLNIRYLWIDTLCIIQDNLEDKGREISQMDMTYTHSTFTVSASDASTDVEGCFLDQRNMAVECTRVRLHEDESEDVVQYICRREEWRGTAGLSAIQRSVLAGRAWVFQERLLSPRTLHCLRSQFHWECHTLEASELSPLGPGPERRFMRSTFKSLLSNQLESAENADIEEARAQAQDDWRHIVENYSRAHLTFAEDKLRALAGVTAVWQRIHADEYLFGLWRSTILSDLCWLRLNTEQDRFKHQARPEHAVAPSWSWASIRSPVFFHPGISLSSAAVEEATLKLLDVEFDAASHSRNSISPDSPSHEQNTYLAALRLRGRPSEARILAPLPGRADGVYGLSFKTQVEDTSANFDTADDTCHVYFDTVPDHVVAQVLCLPLVRDDETYSLDVEMEVSWGLALVHVGDDYYRRVGIFKTFQLGLFDGEMEELRVI